MVVSRLPYTSHVSNIYSQSTIPKDESDEEESTAYKSSNIEMNGEGADPNNLISDGGGGKANKKKKRRWRRNDPRPRRWVVQEKAEFYDRIRKRRQRSSAGGGDVDDDDIQGKSNQYHGVVEANASKYVILSVASTTTTNDATSHSTPSSKVATEQISIQPIYGFHTFSQPYKTASLSMEEAENAIERQRNVVTRYMMHGKLSAVAQGGNSSEAKAALASGVTIGGAGRRGIGSRPLGPAPKAMSRARLLGKLAGGGGDDDDDDVMGDVRFSTTTKGSSKARKELLSSLGDEGMTADDDGVLGGANDGEFGGRRRFARVSAKNADDDAVAKKKGVGNNGGATSTGFEAAAMEEGFYQRDVAAEYEALDYDADEQFDDDDVNVGEDEMMDDGGGYGGGDFHDSGDDNMLEGSDEEGEGSDGDDDAFRGMATASGLRAMLAKARGESPVNVSADGAASAAATAMMDESMDEGDVKAEGIDVMVDAAKTTAADDTLAAASSEEKKIAPVPIEKDKDGKRLITLEAVRREIWLNGGSIASKRLMKKFDVTKKNPDRQELFKQIVMELCTMQKDADGNKLVLKQHYSKM